MTQQIESIADVADGYDAVVFDQWGVLHDGSTPYPGAIACLEHLAKPVTVLSNSGKRAAPNAQRIKTMGFERAFDVVMTSGEALWQDIARGVVSARRFFPIERAPGDAALWAEGVEITLTELPEAEAILLMGLPDGNTLQDWQPVLHEARARGLPVYCSNPDHASPRAGGTVISPGTLAVAYQQSGGEVRFYGKPHAPVFETLAAMLGKRKLLMVGDSLDHDIAGAARVGWDSVLVGGGLLSARFEGADWQAVLADLDPAHAPTYFMGALR